MSAKAQILKALSQDNLSAPGTSFGGLTRSELKAAVSASNNGFRGRLSEMMFAGYVRKTNSERYVLTALGHLKAKEF